MTDYKALYEQSQKENAELKKRAEDHLASSNHYEEQGEDHLASCNFYEEQCQELKDERRKLKEKKQKLNALYQKEIDENSDLEDEIRKLKVHFNLLIQLIKGCKTEEQLEKLKELPHPFV